MGKMSRLKNLGENYLRERLEKGLTKPHEQHAARTYPYSEEDGEGVITWESPRKCSMVFKGISVNDGYVKTMNKFKSVNMNSFVSVNIVDNSVVVEF